MEKFHDNQRLSHLKSPTIIIAGSGMCTGDRNFNHLKHGVADPENDLLFAGYQAECNPSSHR